MSLAPECQAIADEIEAMEAEKRDLQAELQQAAPGQKAFLAAQIKALIRAIAAAEVRLTDCIERQPPPDPPPPPLDSVLVGTVTLTTTKPEAPGPFSTQVTVGMVFNGERTFVGITSFPPIANSFDTPVGRNTTTITKSSGGTGSYAAGSMNIPIELHFDQSIDLPFFDEDSDLPLVLSTSPPGSPVDSAGAVTLVGSGTFQKGFLAGATGTVNLTGRLSPVP